jgi:tRNA threonylcarbamoyladenosine biosynthesis protein TsaB
MYENKEIKILAIESSGSTCGIAISTDNVILCEYSFYNKNLHDKLLADLIQRALKDCSLNIDEIDAVAISSGPGSFTGLRIGASIAKGLCFGGKPKLISVPTLQSLVYSQINIINFFGLNNIIALLPSHKNLYYFQEFSNQMEELSEIKLMEIENIFSNLENKFVVIGTEIIKLQIDSKFIVKKNLEPASLAKLAYLFYKEEKFVSADDYVPLYVQDFVPK